MVGSRARGRALRERAVRAKTEADTTLARTTAISGSGERDPASLHLITVAPHSGSGRPGQSSSAIAEEDVLHRLALWLADVSAEATFAQMSPEVTVAPWPTRSKGPSLAGSPR
jgi:hypothetical protein